MNLKNAKIFLCILIIFTVCQYTQTQATNTIQNIIKYVDADSVGYEIIENNDPNVTTYIFGGSYAAPVQFPYMAVVHRLINKNVIEICSGTIISNRWVLTAGHCVVEYPQRFLVVFGNIDKSGIKYDQYYGPGVSMITTEVVLHPNYKETVNDIALLHMPYNIPFSNTIQPIKLADHNYEDEVLTNKNGIIIGWGKDSMIGPGTTNLKYAELPIISNYECKMYWQITNKHICTSSGLNRDTCQGDSGGPLIITENGKDIQVGIVSYGDQYCPGNLPRVFTRVSSFTYWIYYIINTYWTYI